MSYKIKTLLDSGYDFNQVFVEKQKSIAESTGMDFTLGEIAQFLKKQTNNFTIDNTIAHDLDEAIFNLVEKYKEEEKDKDGGAPMPQPAGASPYSPEELKEWSETIVDLQALIDEGIYSAAEVEEWEQTIKDLNDLLSETV
jgi:hypothetical protein